MGTLRMRITATLQSDLKWMAFVSTSQDTAGLQVRDFSNVFTEPSLRMCAHVQYIKVGVKRLPLYFFPYTTKNFNFHKLHVNVQCRKH